MRLMAAAGMVQVEELNEKAKHALVEVAYTYRLGTFGTSLSLEQWSALHPAEREAMVQAGRLLLRDLIDDVASLLAPATKPEPTTDKLEAMLDAATDQAMQRVVDEVTA